jgi:hypothetical protein
MSESADIVQMLLKKFIKELKQQPSLSYAGHKNLWIDLGWDITQGDREICNHVEDMLRYIIDSLPDDVKEVLWSESWGGKVKMKALLNELKQPHAALANRPKPEAHEIVEDIVEYLKDRVFSKAEAAYDQYQDSEAEEFYADEATEEEAEEDE